jgi:hypothetical protein
MTVVPDGYERWPDPDDGPGLRLLDPAECPAGHPFTWGTRQSLVYCPEHERHNSWRCKCGQWIYRGGGGFVGELGCVS